MIKNIFLFWLAVLFSVINADFAIAHDTGVPHIHGSDGTIHINLNEYRRESYYGATTGCSTKPVNEVMGTNTAIKSQNDAINMDIMSPLMETLPS